MPTTLPPDIEAHAINIIRGFAMDAPLRAKSGHQGTAMALAPLANVLYSRVLKHDPDRPGVARSRPLRPVQRPRLDPPVLDAVPDRLRAASSPTSRPSASTTRARRATPRPVTRRASRSRPARSARASATPSAWPSPSACCASASAATSSTTTPTSSPATAASWRASATRRPRSPGTSALGRLICVYDDNRVTIDGSDRVVVLRRRRPALRRLRLERASYSARSATTATRSRPHCSRRRPTTRARRLLVLRSHIGTPSPDHTDDPAAHGNPFTAEDVTRTKDVMGIPDEPFWAPEEVVATYRDTVRQRVQDAKAAVERGVRRARRRRAGGVGRGLERHRVEGLGGRPADVRAGQGGGHPPGDGEGARRGVRPVPRDDLGCRRPDRQHRREAVRRRRPPDGREPGRAPDLLRHPRARDGRGIGRHGHARRDPAVHGDVLRVPRLHAPAGPARRALQGQGPLRVEPRLGRRRRGRSDPPADRAPGDAAGDPRSAGDPAGRRQRDRRRLPCRRRPRRRVRRRSCSPARASRCARTARPSSAAPASSPT